MRILTNFVASLYIEGLGHTWGWHKKVCYYQLCIASCYLTRSLAIAEKAPVGGRRPLRRLWPFKVIDFGINWKSVFSEFMFAICRHPSVCL